ncbi:BTB/POZ domain-containing protein [Ditylenchus destructor]|nr:BTB/POZ domain-containing protein [Ditylenchus destructor]
MYNLRKSNRPLNAQNIVQIASTPIEDVEIEKAVTNVHCKEATIPGWDPTENIVRDYEDFYKPKGVIELRIDRFTEFARSKLQQKKMYKYQQRLSASTFIRGLPWEISASIRDIDNERFLGLFLYCNQDSTSTTWNCRAMFTLYAVAQKKDCNDHSLSYDEKHSFYCNNNGFGFKDFISINTLLDPEKGFINYDAVILRAYVEADIPSGTLRCQDARMKVYHDAFGPVDKTQSFSSSTQLQSNFVLVVQGKEVHVQTNFLSIHSPYFHEQFAKNESAKKAILENIDHDEFIELLGVIYPSRYPITAENVETISKLAHIFKMTGLLRECEVILMVNYSISDRLKLFLIAYWYNLEHLQAKCINECKTVISDTGILKHLSKEPEFALLDCRMKALLLDKLVEVNTSAAPPDTNRSEASVQKAVLSSRPLEILKALACACTCVPNDTNRSEASVQKAVLSSRPLEILNALASSNSVPSDAVLIVENKRIPIHKQYLSMHSEHFKAMFMGEFQEKNQEEIVLDEVGYADMLELLAVVYPATSAITEENIEAILKLADRFNMPSVLDKCKKALNCRTSLKLWIAQRYKFSHLQFEFAQQCKSVECVEKLKAEPEYALLDVKTRALIFDSITS